MNFNPESQQVDLAQNFSSKNPQYRKDAGTENYNYGSKDNINKGD